MNLNRRRRWCVVLFLLLSAAASAAAAVPRVVVSIKPVHSLVAGLMRDVAEPELLIDGTRAPWQYSPSAEQLKAVRAADLLIWTGPELEPGLVPVLEQLGEDILVLEMLENQELKILPARDHERLRDPFFWLDSRNMLILIDSLTRVLSELDPEHAQVYERNRHKSLESIAQIDREMEFRYRDVSGVPVFFYHDTHQYFEQAYAMNVAATVVGVPAQGGNTTARLLELRGRISETPGACLFTEKSLDHPHLRLVLSGSRVEPIELDALGSTLKPGPDLYVELMRQDFEAIARCVRALKAPQSTAPDRAETADVRRFPDEVIPRYMMRDQYGRAVTADDFAGSLQLIYFGYTYCPDICPMSLAVMAQALKILGPAGEQIQPIFITVDPARDTPEVLRDYVAYFHPRMLGLSAGPEITKRTAELFKARYEKVDAEDGDPARYTMDHTASLFLLGRNGEFITKFAHGLPATEVAERLLEYLEN